MGNTCCQPEEELVLNTLEGNKNENDSKRDKYPHDSDPAFKRLKTGEQTSDIKQLSNEDMIDE